MVTFATMVTLLAKEHGQQGNHGSEEISSEHTKFGNLGNTGSQGYYVNVTKPGKQGNTGNFKINGHVSNEDSFECVWFFHVKCHMSYWNQNWDIPRKISKYPHYQFSGTSVLRESSFFSMRTNKHTNRQT
jgi:hypothetical protein